ncbi:transposase [Rhodoblastus sphagnicola]|nr:transposase [Rhodoblastus sphagnicola]
MARAYSQDLRDRVIEAALSGVSSARGSAGHFGIGVATAIVWVRRARQTGDRKAHKQGAAKPRKLEPHRDFLLALIDETPDLSLDELLARLLKTHGVTVARSTLWTFLDRCGLTLKKWLTRVSRIARTSARSAKIGLTGKAASPLTALSSLMKPG